MVKEVMNEMVKWSDWCVRHEMKLTGLMKCRGRIGSQDQPIHNFSHTDLGRTAEQ